jgi:hypothetical protein
MMDDHIVYWLLDTCPLSKSTTHPSNISMEFLLDVVVRPGTTIVMELSRILGREPGFIVTEPKGENDYLQGKPKAQDLLESTLTASYELVN